MSNESSQIIRLLNSIKIQSKIEILNIKDCNQKFLDLINNSINDGVYKCGFARNQSAYKKASKNLFAAINEIENLLQKNKGGLDFWRGVNLRRYLPFSNAYKMGINI